MKWLASQLEQQDVTVIDCRFVLGSPEAGREAYRQGHIPGAYYFHLEEDLSGPKEEHGGRHPLPDFEALAAKLASTGIKPGGTIVAYDDQGGAMSSRLWWLLKYIGIEASIFVMDEGFTKWKEAGYPVTEEIPPSRPGEVTVNLQPQLLASMEDVKQRIGREGVVLIDSREEPRFRGLAEHIDPVAGHIPSAINLFWKANLDAEGRWKPIKEQQARFEKLQGAKELIVYCGSGVTACPNVLALEEAGFTNVKLYAGSWSDWITYPDNPVAKA
nr:sulfurtransferase [Paenibacillus turpanensis]